MEALTTTHLPKLEVSFLGSEEEGFLAVDFVAEAETYSEQLCASLPRRLAEGEVTIQTPEYGETREILFLDRNEKPIAVISITIEQCQLIDNILFGEGEISLDPKTRFLTPSFRVTKQFS